MKIKKPIKILAVTALLAGAVFAGYKMYDMASEYKNGELAYEQVLQAAIYSAPPAQTASPPTSAEPELPEESPGFDYAGTGVPLIDFRVLSEENSDTVGWIYIKDTNINYPVVQGEDNRHYVSTLFNGQPNQAGSIFMDFRNDPDMGDVHSILYGHNMQNKTMFADILNYQTQEYYDAHPVGYYITPDRIYSFEIVAGYVASLAEAAWQLEFAAEEESLAWINEAIGKTAFVSRVQPQEGDRFISLSTCSYEFEDARFVLTGIIEDCGSPGSIN